MQRNTTELELLIYIKLKISNCDRIVSSTTSVSDCWCDVRHAHFPGSFLKFSSFSLKFWGMIKVFFLLVESWKLTWTEVRGEVRVRSHSHGVLAPPVSILHFPLEKWSCLFYLSTMKASLKHAATYSKGSHLVDAFCGHTLQFQQQQLGHKLGLFAWMRRCLEDLQT